MRDCENCGYRKPIIRDGEYIGMGCSKWTCVEEEKEQDKPDLDCALRD